ncbi:uncharacterized protein LOC114213661 [Eumetopias jubatus]|uniref:uncharacterized protein LOC114213661 n=1 Tax=Eumetopias jubatus TaxID=34886 RepID=UPI001016683E|nr:uncharacterized protein LOC114213661 [Eumetopias jubatus]
MTALEQAAGRRGDPRGTDPASECVGQSLFQCQEWRMFLEPGKGLCKDFAGVLSWPLRECRAPPRCHPLYTAPPWLDLHSPPLVHTRRAVQPIQAHCRYLPQFGVRAGGPMGAVCGGPGWRVLLRVLPLLFLLQPLPGVSSREGDAGGSQPADCCGQSPDPVTPGRTWVPRAQGSPKGFSGDLERRGPAPMASSFWDLAEGELDAHQQ